MPPKVQPNPAPFNLTPREVEIAVIAWKALEGDIKINNTKLATMANIGKTDSAGRMWRSIKAKIEAGTAGPAGLSAPAASTLATSKKNTAAKNGKKRTKKEADTDDGGDSDAESADSADKGGKPKKKVAKRTKVKQEAPADSEGMDVDAGANGEV